MADVKRDGHCLGRRDFVRRLPVLTAGFAGAVSSVSLTGCAGTRYLAPAPRPEGLSVTLEAVGPEGAAFLQAPNMDRPIYLHRDDTGAWVALLASCTHQGCQPEPVAQRLVCPCHGSEFSMTGEVLQGPADRPLIRYDVTHDGDHLIVRTGGMAR